MSVLAACPGTDVLACETLPSLMEMEALVSSVGQLLFQHVPARSVHGLSKGSLPLSLVTCPFRLLAHLMLLSTRAPYLSGTEPPEAPSRCTQGLA